MGKKVGRKTKYHSEVKPKLKQISEYIAQGATEKDIMEWLGIANSTFYEYKNKYPEFRESLDKPKRESVIQVRNALLKRALGFTYEEKKQYLTKDKETGKETLRVETFQKQALPDVGAIAMYLRNNDKDYKDRDQAHYEYEEMLLELKKQAQEMSDW